ncbi:MAG: HlyD family efflux transporter periplasmic adaptor subunit [Pseudohongiellaceae bacterium]|nr:HlyD family efflux transporter periplasmic adaptor subunit [Pseudohongiellaceae bacterium]
MSAQISVAGGVPQRSQALGPLPPLREELDLYPGAETLDGSPSWVLQDPVAHRFFRIGPLDFELLSRWHTRDANLICEQVNAETVHQASLADVENLARFLSAHNLLQSRGAAAISRLQEQSDRMSHSGLKWLLKNYLFVRIPLLHPDKFLTRSLPYLRWLGSKAFLLAVAFCAVIGIYLAQRQWDGFLNSFPHFFTLPGLVMMVCALALAKVLHEFGHAYCAKNFGCRVPTIGVAFLVLWPVLYTDASDSWRLRSRKQRLMIGAAGMATELVIAVMATLLWSFLSDGPFRSAVFLLATATWIVTLFVNLNPFMRFDGYYLLSDLLGIPNLQERAFALAKWRMREFLFAWGEPKPETFSRRMQSVLLIYAYGTWVYRFFLFLGIALLVYFLFFKALGIFLMLVELLWFIGKPIFDEINAWRERGKILRRNFQSRRTLAILLALAFLLFFPWQSDVNAPAMWQSATHAQVYSSSAGKLEQIYVQAGDTVLEGELLFRLESPDLDYQIAQSQKQIEMLTWQTENQNFNRELQMRSRVAWQELEAETVRHNSLLQEKARLSIRSPIAGEVKEIQAALSEGDWLAENELLAVIANTDRAIVEAFVGESDLARIEAGAEGTFFPEDIYRSSFAVSLIEVDSASTAALSEDYLASTQGGPIAVRQDDQGRLFPENPIYRVQASPEGSEDAPSQRLRGTLKLKGERISIAARVLRSAYAILIRESGF